MDSLRARGVPTGIGANWGDRYRSIWSSISQTATSLAGICPIRFRRVGGLPESNRLPLIRTRSMYRYVLWEDGSVVAEVVQECAEYHGRQDVPGGPASGTRTPPLDDDSTIASPDGGIVIMVASRLVSLPFSAEHGDLPQAAATATREDWRP